MRCVSIDRVNQEEGLYVPIIHAYYRSDVFQGCFTHAKPGGGGGVTCTIYTRIYHDTSDLIMMIIVSI